MKPRGLLLPILALLAALACNLPFQSPAIEIAPTALLTAPPAVLPTSAPVLAPTQPPAPSPTLPADLPSPLPSSTPEPPAPAPPTAPPPVVSPVQLHNPYAVVLVAQNDVLNVRKAPGASNPVVGTLPPDATGLQLTARQAIVGDDRWVELRLPAGGTGWVNAVYLTEQVSSADFCADPQVTRLIEGLQRALMDNDGKVLGSLASPAHGLDVAYLHNGNIANYSPEEAGWLFQSDYVMDWGAHPASGLEVTGSFRKTVLPDLMDVLGSTYQTQCNKPDLGGGNYTYTWPVRYQNINYLVLHKPGPPGNELAWRTWIAGIEYVGGQPTLFALVHLFWEP